MLRKMVLEVLRENNKEIAKRPFKKENCAILRLSTMHTEEKGTKKLKVCYEALNVVEAIEKYAHPEEKLGVQHITDPEEVYPAIKEGEPAVTSASNAELLWWNSDVLQRLYETSWFVMNKKRKLRRVKAYRTQGIPLVISILGYTDCKLLRKVVGSVLGGEMRSAACQPTFTVVTVPRIVMKEPYDYYRLNATYASKLEELRLLIQAQLNLFVKLGCTTIILGDWDRPKGIFPESIATIYAEELRKETRITRIVFAIKDTRVLASYAKIIGEGEK